MRLREKNFTGVTSPDVTATEILHQQLSRKAATEGFVLLKNEKQVLPIQKGSKIALFGAGAVKTIKGGTGSGDVNSRETVSIYEGLKNAGYTITSEDWIESYHEIYRKAKLAWRDVIWKALDELKDTKDVNAGFNTYCSHPFSIPAGVVPEKQAEKITDETALFVLSRIAGEGADRFCKEGDYLLTADEKAILDAVCHNYENVVVAINAGGLVDLSFMDEYSNILGLLQLVQPGMEAGNAVADVISGDVVPSGKMTDTWAYRYEDYPNNENYSHNNQNVEKEVYKEDIYVGYRYFDTYDIPVRYGFGYGLSYTNFQMETVGIEHFNLGTPSPEIGVKVKVTNSGAVYSGKEVVQIYVSCPQQKMPKEFRRLVAYEKTMLLKPGQTQEMVIRFPVYAMASFDERVPGWVLEAGCYGIFVGNSLADSRISGSIQLENDFLMTVTEHACPVQEEFEKFQCPTEKFESRRTAMENASKELPSMSLHVGDIVSQTVLYGQEMMKITPEAKAFVSQLSTEQLILLATGDPGKGQGSNLGSSGISVPGSAAETSLCAVEQELGSIVLADGPAGLRLNKSYRIKDGQIVPGEFIESIEDGFLNRKEVDTTGETRYQFCTAIPVGTLLAQTWNPELVEEVGKMVAEELQEFHVTLWLAPGMNIHRNPLCGRNFEYYSEDPVVSGTIAAAMTRGVQKDSGCGTTIKHFACNNQEDNRMASDSILSERALREIYLKGFEIAVKSAQPWSIMTSYNLVNGVHAANSYDLCTKIARDEWNFEGVIMTDWTTTMVDEKCTASGCMRAGNDLVMPGVPADHENMRKELAEGKISLLDLKKRVAHLVEVVWKSNAYDRGPVIDPMLAEACTHNCSTCGSSCNL